MAVKRLITLCILASVLLTGIAPVLAQGVDVLQAAVETYVPNIPQGFGMVSINDLATELAENPDLFLLDVRETSEWTEQGYIPGAVNVPVRELVDKLNLLPADLDEPIVVYCAKGTRGTIVMTVLQMMGYTNVRNMVGGFGAWKEAGNPVATEPVAFEAIGPAEFDPALLAEVDNYLKNVLPQGWGQVSADDLWSELAEKPDLFLLDVREQAELDELGYIEGAVHIPIRQLTANLDKLPADKEIVVYCKVGGRGTIAMVALQMLGYNVRNLAGGIAGWIAEEYPVVGGTASEGPVAVEVVLPEGTVLEAEVVAPLAFDAVQTIASMAGFGTLAEADFAAAMDGAFILDVREVNEYAEGHIAGAVNIPLRELPASLALLPELDEPILVYCGVGYRGAVAQLGLTMLGYTNVMNLRGGLKAWTGETVTEPTTVTPGAFPTMDPDVWATVNAYFTALPQGWGIIAPEDLAAALAEQEIILIDSREPSEYAAGHIAGAINWPTRAFASFVAEGPARDAAIVAYGGEGHRTALAQHALAMAGFSNVRGLAVGSAGWAAAGYELVQ